VIEKKDGASKAENKKELGMTDILRLSIHRPVA
jgi:hypothetical protein